jgi:hypothetical protein
MSKEKCEQCEKVLNPKRTVWLELSNTDGNYYLPENFPKDHISQGAFPFGSTCANKIVKS